MWCGAKWCVEAVAQARDVPARAHFLDDSTFSTPWS